LLIGNCYLYRQRDDTMVMVGWHLAATRQPHYVNHSSRSRVAKSTHHKLNLTFCFNHQHTQCSHQRSQTERVLMVDTKCPGEVYGG